MFSFPVARRFMAGSQMLRQLYFSALDMELHTRYEVQNSSSWHWMERHRSLMVSALDSRSRSPCSGRFKALTGLFVLCSWVTHSASLQTGVATWKNALGTGGCASFPGIQGSTSLLATTSQQQKRGARAGRLPIGKSLTSATHASRRSRSFCVHSTPLEKKKTKQNKQGNCS